MIVTQLEPTRHAGRDGAKQAARPGGLQAESRASKAGGRRQRVS
jgi:hypothetical protein